MRKIITSTNNLLDTHILFVVENNYGIQYYIAHKLTIAEKIHVIGKKETTIENV